MTTIARPLRQAQYGEAIPVTIDDMLHEIASQSRVIAMVMDKIKPQLEAMDQKLFAEIQHIYITGCGDSYFAGLAARFAFEKFTRVVTEPLEALEFGRYVAEFMPENSLVLGISNSGKAARAVEAIINGNVNGATTIAITGNAKGWLGSEANLILDQSVRLDDLWLTMPSNLDGGKPQKGSFGLANYLASLTTLYMTAIHIGRVKGRVTEAQAQVLYDELRGATTVIDETVKVCGPAAKAYAQQVRDVYHFAILGGGPSYATSLFYAAKTFELARVNGVSQELEEWAHEQFFLTGAKSQVMFIAPTGRGNSRVLELINTAKRLDATTVVVADEENTTVRAAADVVLPIAGKIPEYFSPLVFCVPGELFATYLAKARGRNAFEFDSDIQYEMNMRTIQESQVIEFHRGMV